MKVIFFGTPDFVIPILARLHRIYNTGRTRQLIAVVTQPGKEVGRKKYLQRSAVDKWAYDHKIPVITDLSEVPDADLGVVAAYGSIIPGTIINRFKHGILNIHPSLLPEFRGASPVQAAVALGKDQTGVTIIKMDELMDHGPILVQQVKKIDENETNLNLTSTLFELSIPLLMEVLAPFVAGKIRPSEQNHDKATYTRTISRADGYIPGKILENAINGHDSQINWEINFLKDIKLPSTISSIERLSRALTPWPGIWTYVDIRDRKRRLIIKKFRIEDNKLILEVVQLEGKNEVSWKQFKEGYKEFKFSN
jgi:methionyl-tRNA formyltransferase